MRDSAPKDEGSERPCTRRNWFVRSLLIGVALLLVSMIVYAFFIVEPRGEISTGLVTLVVLLIVVVLSEAFDTFSIGQLLELSRENRRKDEVIARMREEVRLLSAAAEERRSGDTRNGSLVLQGFSEADREQRDALERATGEGAEGGPANPDDLGRMREAALAWVLAELDLEGTGVLRDVKLSERGGLAAAPSAGDALFDAYVTMASGAWFIRVLPASIPYALQVLLIETVLAFTLSYGHQQGLPVRLVVVVAFSGPRGPDRISGADGELRRRFAAAIESGLLQLREYPHATFPTV